MRPTDPSWIDGYRTAMRDAENVVRMWCGVSRAQAVKLTNPWEAAVSEEAVRLLGKLLGVFNHMAKEPRRDLTPDDEVTPVEVNVLEEDDIE